MNDSAERLAVVTGGTKGIGLSFSQRLVKGGYRVVALYRADEESARAAAEQIGDGFVAIRADVSDPAVAARVTREVLDHHGTPWALVLNAGRNIDRPFLDLTDDDWRQVLDANLSAPFYLTRRFAPAMLAAGGGCVVTVGATTAIRPRLNGVNYCASKAGLLHLTKCLALELAPAIRVNCLIPGMIDTEEMRTRYRTAEPEHLASLLDEIPQRRIGSPDEMAAVLEFLLSEEARYITGQKIIVDGGQFMW
ncbi:beta-ketoacyl-ACP reductase [Sphaerisporangium melleum]|uniref:Beta-ketoacyl-ACP reductase n=1 Tax=Sphaerisporangium melleum TaxID=321316 RepID=A0A917VW75_9ACTN|nr:SDR family NAD(P)-dependent oxidoreductase [Sphaerisporangium melleum]GGL20461.1 beta-ketoacyl-ACP reductase [Sphaerisporangium melleum]GII74918.1 beta-ketoacyl-ACP reductase [Sphaerisporangium melleum]